MALEYIGRNRTYFHATSSYGASKIQLISLNIWGGHIKESLLEFIKSYKNADIFCFQEVYNNASHKISTDDKAVSLDIFSEIGKLLPEHNGFFSPVVGNGYGIAIFIKKEIDILGTGNINIHENPHYTGSGPTHSRIMQWLQYSFNGQIYTIFNVHGLWNGKGKTDTIERINQSKKIKNFVNSIKTPQILCGDFNLTLNTESIKILEKGMKNLIKLYNIRSTRSNIYEKEEKFADYFFTSHDVSINKFEVLKEEVSDHSPLLLEINDITHLSTRHKS